MKCSKCGADFPDDAKFCPYCGRRVSVPTKGKGEAEGVKELTLGLVKLLGSALGVSVLLNMKLLLEQDGEPSKATEKVEDMLRSADLYGEKEEAAVKEAEEFCREMNSQVSDAVSEAVGSVTGNLEKAFTGIGKVVGKVASEFEKAVAKSEPEEKAEEAAEAAEKVTGEAAEEVAGAAEEFAAAVDKAMADVEKTLGEIFEKNEAPAPSAEEDADEEIPISDADETKETPSWFVMSDATGQELLEEELYSNELAGERVSPAEPEAPAEEAEAEGIPVEISEETEEEIMETISSFKDVSEPHNLRTRRIGNRIAIEAHIRMDGNMSLLQAHEITSEIEKKLKDRFGAQTIVTLHMEPTR